MSQPWMDRLTVYLDELQVCAESIDQILDETKVSSTELDQPEVERLTGELVAAHNALEHKIGEREALLRAADAPPLGSTLTEKVRQSNQSDSERVAKRCEQIAGTIEMANYRAISLFVCQYKLADFTSEITRLLSGVTTPPTYGNQNERPSPSGGGALFNEAA